MLVPLWALLVTTWMEKEFSVTITVHKNNRNDCILTSFE
jgi:hypothetical protein